jgi:hypothetical protein
MFSVFFDHTNAQKMTLAAQKVASDFPANAITYRKRRQAPEQ